MQLIKSADQAKADPFARLVAAQQALIAAQDEEKAARKAVVAHLEETGKTTADLEDGDVVYNFRVSRRTTTAIDEKGLRKALGARVFDKFTERKLNRKKLEDAIDQGAVDQLVVAQYVEAKKSEPFLTFTAKDRTSE